MTQTDRPQRYSPAKRRFLTFVAWRRRNIAPGVTLIALAVITGVLAGIVAFVLKFCIGRMCTFFLSFMRPDSPNWYLIGLPILGIMAVGIYQRYILHFNLEHGTERIIALIHRRQYRMAPRLCYAPVIASIATLGFGGSAGAEGPAASSGAAIGSNVGRLFGVSPHLMRIMIGCGAGAGIAGIFKAPIGGAMFTLEVMKMKISTISVLALIVSAVCGGMTCYSLTGFTFDVMFLPTSFFDPHMLGWVTLLGLFCGLYSIYYNHITLVLHRFFKKISNPWLRNLTGASIVGLSLLLFPSLYGEGYTTITDLVNGRTDTFLAGGLFNSDATDPGMLLLLAFVLMLIKVFATIATNSAGGVAGDFAPTIFAGAFAGLVFAWGANRLFDAELPVALFALFGTAGAFSGIIHAPLMAMFLVAEMLGNGYGYFLPLMVVASVSYLTVKIVTPLSRYADHDDLAALLHFHSRSDSK